MGSPGQGRIPIWPLSPQPPPSETRLYPTLPADELDEAKQRQARSRLPGNTAPSQAQVSSIEVCPKPSDNVQDLFSPAPKLPRNRKESVGIPRSEPFLFGSPLPRHSVSNKAFDSAAASVLEEMNKRLSAAGKQPVGADVFGTVPVATAATNRDSGSLRAPGMVDRFDKLHEEQFNKMDSIANHYAARRGAPGSKKRKSDVFGHGSVPARKRSSADTHVVGTASRKRMGIPGGFDDEEEVEDDVQQEADRRMSKRVRVLEGDGGKDKGRRLTISPRKTEAEEKQTVRERAAMRKMLEVRKEKRRSSRHAGPQAASSEFFFSLSHTDGHGVTNGDSCRQGQGDASLRNSVLSQVDRAQRVELRRRLSHQSLADKHGSDSQVCYWCGRAEGIKARTTSGETTFPSSVATIDSSRSRSRPHPHSHFCIKQGIGSRSSKRQSVPFPTTKLADQFGGDENAKLCASGIN